VITDNDVFKAAADKFGEEQKNYEKAVFDSPSVFNSFTREKEISVAEIRCALSELLQDKQIIYGFSSLLLPEKINHALKILTIAEQDYRISNASERGFDEKNAKKLINQADSKATEFCHHIKNTGPWKPDLYDMVIAMDKTSVEKAYELILSQLANPVLNFNDESEKRLEEFRFESKAALELCKKGFDVDISASDSDLELTINKKVLFLSKLKNELQQAALEIDGVNNVEIKIGKHYYKADILANMEFTGSPRALLVDDEQDFVQTLSE
jgi:hypothetical protein